MSNLQKYHLPLFIIPKNHRDLMANPPISSRLFTTVAWTSS